MSARPTIAALIAPAAGVVLLFTSCVSVEPHGWWSPTRIPGDFLKQQLLVFSSGRRTQSLSVVVQKKDDTITLVALMPFGSRAFVIEQHGGDEARFTPGFFRAPPFPPDIVVGDIARTYAPGLPGAPFSAGWHEAKIGGERVRELWSDGSLVQRNFLGRQLAIHYAGPTVEIDDRRFGYHLRVEMISETRL